MRRQGSRYQSDRWGREISPLLYSISRPILFDRLRTGLAIDPVPCRVTYNG